MDRNNLGTFSITVDLVEKNPHVVANIFAKLKIVPVEIKWKFNNRAIKYTAICDQFELITAGQEVPEYNIGVKSNEAGEVLSATAVKI